MKVKIKRWHGVMIWKWEIDEDVCIFDQFVVPYLRLVVLLF